ncbi:MAG: hypothetical protein ABW104_19025 [Candidatus Thiodiazotropha sp. 6PLUC2]
MIFQPMRLAATLLFGLLAVFLFLNRAYAMDTGYIDAVKADAAEFSTNEFHPPANSMWLGDDENESSQVVDLQGFSEHIRTKSPGSYIFYKKLTAEYQNKLHQDYLATGDLDRVKQDIFKYTKEMKQQSRTSRYTR